MVKKKKPTKGKGTTVVAAGPIFPWVTGWNATSKPTGSKDLK